MHIPLTRIEYEYILTAFMETPPPLYLQSGAIFHSLPSDTYTMENNRIYFVAPSEFIDKTAIVFFDHKKRSISFYTRVQEHNHKCYFSLPDLAYKYNPDMQKKEQITAEIYLQENTPITAWEHEAFPLDTIIHANIQPPAFIDFLPSAYRNASQYAGGNFTENTFPLFFYRLNEFEQHTSMIFNPKEHDGLYILFIDSKMLICGCKDDYAVSIGKRQSIQFALHFPHRTIRIPKGRSLFSHFIPKRNSAVLGFLFEDVFEEDKRFLYEHVYHEKYNPAHLGNGNQIEGIANTSLEHDK